MADPTLTPTYFDGTAINDAATYDAKFLAEHDVASTPDFEPIEVEVPGEYAFPTSPRSQPQSRVFPLYVKIPSTQAGVYAFKKLFDPAKGDCILKVDDGDATTWRMTVRVMRAPQFSHQVNLWIVQLYAARPIWLADSESSDEQTVSAAGGSDTWQVTVGGTTRTYPTIEFKPTVAANHSNKYLRRQYINIAWRSELPGVSTNGLPYQTELGEDAIDLSALFDASQLQADGADFRVYVDGVEIDRFIKTDLTDDYIWTGITWAPMRRLMLKDNMSDVSPANGEWFDVSDPEGTLGWDNDGYFMIDDETFHYVDREARRLKLSSTNGRGARNSTAAAHTGGTDYLYWMEHEIYALYDNEAAANPPAASDRQPVIDLANSTNALHKYPGPLTAPTTLRPGQMLRRYTNDNLLSPAISFLENGTDADFRDVAPSALAPRYNNLELSVPCGVKAAAGAISHDVTVNKDVLNLQVYGIDMGGLEALLERYTSYNDGTPVTLQPASVLSRIRYNANIAMVTGAWLENPDDEEVTQAVRAQQFVIDQETFVRHLLGRFKKVGSPTGDIHFYLLSDNEDSPDAQISDIYTVAASDLDTAYADYVAHVAAAGYEPYIVLPAGTYWLAYKRSTSVASIYMGISSRQVYGRGKYFVGGGEPEGPNSGSTFVDDPLVAGDAWADKNNAGASDDAYATVAPTGSSQFLKATGFGFSIPAAATIDGIECEFEAHGSIAGILAYARIVKAGTIGAAYRSMGFLGTSADVYIGAGGPADLWGETWTYTEINAANFGTAIRVHSSGGGRTANLDHLRITVHYSLGEEVKEQTVRFAVLATPEATIQPEAPSGSAHEITLDDIDVTLDDATPRTPKIVVAAQETIYHLAGVLKNDDTGQTLTLDFVLPVNSPTLTIDCEAHTVVRSDTGESVPGVVAPSDLVEWMRLDPGTVNLRYTEAGIGTVVITTTWRNRWA